MKRTTHLSAGASLSIALSQIAGVDPISAVLVGCFASLLPDIDHGYSAINQYLIKIYALKGNFFKVYYGLIAAVLAVLFHLTHSKALLVGFVLVLLIVIGHHRSIYHSLIIMAPLAVFLVYMKMPTVYIAIFLLNYFLHLILDTFNPSGVPLLLPFSPSRTRLPITFDSSGNGARFVEAAVIFISISYALKNVASIILKYRAS